LDNILLYILIGLGGFFAVQLLAKLFVFYWQKGYESRKKKREDSKAEKLKWKYSKIELDNPVLCKMMNDRTIVFMGAKGKGKSLTMSAVAHFLWLKRLERNKKQRRYLRYIQPEYVEQQKKLDDKLLLPVYSNMDLVDRESGAKSQELEPYFELRKKAVEGAIFCIDEISSTYGKDMYNNDEYSKAEKKDIKENSKKNRHFTNGWILGTEQDGADIFIGIRENGYAIVHCLETVRRTSKVGKFLRWICNFFNFILPAYLTTNSKILAQECLFKKQKVALFARLLLPSYISAPRAYYLQKQRINEAIKWHFEKFNVRFDYGGYQYWMTITHDDLFEYNTRNNKKDYDAMFDKDGKRKKENNNAENKAED